MYYGNHIYITPTGFQNLKNRLNRLYKERVALGKELRDVKEPGNIDENISYTIARSKTIQIESNMQQIQSMLKNAILIKKPKRKNMIDRGSTVKLKAGSDIKEFTVVGSLEADPKIGLISDQSPVGQQLLKKRVGNQVEIGNGRKVTYTILAIE